MGLLLVVDQFLLPPFVIENDQFLAWFKIGIFRVTLRTVSVP